MTAIDIACAKLVHRLEQLSKGAQQAKQRITTNCLEQLDSGNDDGFRDTFKAMADGMTGALGDIVERIAQLDKILYALEAGSPEAPSAMMPTLPRRSPARSVDRKPRTRRKSRQRTSLPLEHQRLSVG